MIAPLFEADRFPSWAYQRGGVINKRSYLPREQWTVGWVQVIANWAMQMERREMPLYLMGHSAGAQFLGRVMAYSNVRVARAVIANPSTYVWPSFEVEAPFGLGGLYRNEAELRAYLAKPIVIAIGEEDTGEENLSQTPQAMAQGANRFERARNVFAAAQNAARARGWQLGWQLVVVPGAGHNSRSIYRSNEVMATLRAR